MGYLLLLPVLVSLASGCGSVPSSSALSDPVPANLHPPIAGAHVYLLAAGSTGLSAASTSLLVNGRPGVSQDAAGNTFVTTRPDGSFTLTGLYACADPSARVYVVATGGSSGAATSNSAIALSASAGTCSALSPATSLQINELTTTAFASAFASFAADAFHLGAPANEAAALADADTATQNLVATATGAVQTAAGSTVIPYATVNTLANALAACVHSQSAGSCASLFAASATGNSTPQNTFAAALAVAQHPAANVPALFNLAASAAPFQPALTQPPADWTLAPQIAPAALAQTQPVLLTLGDSISTLAPGNGASPPTLGYTQLLSNALSASGSASPVSYAQGGDESIDLAQKAWLYGVQAASLTPPVTLMIGANDVNFEDPGATSTGHQQAFRDFILATASLWLTPPANKLIPYGNPACSYPGWGYDGSLPGSQNGSGIYTGIQGAPATCTYTSFGDPIYVWHLITRATGTAAVAIDGVVCGSYTTDYPGYLGSHNGINNSVAALRCPAAAGLHTITVTMTSGFQVSLQGFGTAPAAPATVAAPPRMYTFGPTHRLNGDADPATFLYSKLLENASAQLAADGFLIQYVNVRDHVTYTGIADPGSTAAPGSACMYDLIHPSNCGHAQIATVLSGVIPKAK